MMRLSKLAISASVIFVIATTIGLIGWKVDRALESEKILQAEILVFTLVTSFVEVEGRWPESWEDLELNTVARSWGGWQWPRDKEPLAKRIAINFEYSISELQEESPTSFSAIRPRQSNVEFSLYQAPWLKRLKQVVQKPNKSKVSGVNKIKVSGTNGVVHAVFAVFAGSI